MSKQVLYRLILLLITLLVHGKGSRCILMGELSIKAYDQLPLIPAFFHIVVVFLGSPVGKSKTNV